MGRRLTAIRKTLGTIAGSYVTVIVVALLVAAAFAPTAWGTTSGPDGTVAVIEVDQMITEPVADEVAADLREARRNDSIDAVVLRVDSPGGGVAASERLSLAVERTADEMPVVTSVGSMAASGGYYLSAPSDEIYVTPGSWAGSIGVRLTHAEQPPMDQEITTGPDKNNMFTEEEATQQADQLQQAFIGSVMEHRGDELELSETELGYAKVYTGIDSVENGLADEIGDTEAAIGAAAEMAGLDDYEIVEMEREQPVQQFVMADGSGDGPEIATQHPQTFGDYGGAETPAFLALWGHVESETAVDTDDSARTSGAEAAPASGGERP